MVVELQSHEAPPRFTSYVDELRRLLSERHLPSDSRERIGAVAHQLAAPSALTEAMGAAVRSIVYREPGGMAEGALLGLLVAAAAGTWMDLETASDELVRGNLRKFLGSSLRAFHRESADAPFLPNSARSKSERPSSRVDATVPEVVPPNDASASPAFSEKAEAIHSPSSASDAHIADNQLAVDAEVARMLAADHKAGWGVAPQHYFEEIRVLDEKVDSAPTLPTRAPREPRIQQARKLPTISEAVSHDHPSTREEDEGEFPEYRSLRFFRAEHRTLWIVGMCGVLLGLLLGIFLRGRANPNNAPVNSSPRIGAAPVILAKPSPHGTGPSSKVAVSVPFKHVRETPSQESPVGSLSGSPARRADSVNSESGSLPVRVAGHSTTQAPTARFSEETIRGTDIAEPVPGGGKHSAGPTGAVYLSASGAMASNLMTAPAPLYPAEAWEAGVQGKVVVQALIGRDGRVLDAHVMSGDRRLRGAALGAVERWRYRPFIADGRPSEIETVATLDFRLLE